MDNQTENNISDPETWVDRYGDYLYTYAYRRTQDEQGAEDLVQETFLAALGARAKFQGRSSVKTWLTSILKHKLLDRYRKQYREVPHENIEMKADELDDLFDEKGHWKVGPAKWVANPQKHYEQKQFMEALGHCLKTPPKRLSEAFMLRELDGMTTKEICKVLNVSETNLWVMLHRARIYIRECIERSWLNPKELKEVIS
ncbi:sigma-70 family RNA polymerase sigma factor [Thermodesulfobacteriota bacterium]